MFTGLIQAIGQVVAIEPRGEGGDGVARVQIIIDTCGWTGPGGAYQARRGDSIAINGCCLTVAAVLRGGEVAATAGGDVVGAGSVGVGGAGGVLAFDVVPETLSKTTLGQLRAGSRVNLERSLAAGDLMGGHMVQGHVEGVGEVVRVEGAGGDYRMTIRAQPGLMAAIVPKGSVTVDGVSLTVAEVGRGGGGQRGDQGDHLFTVALIPTTLEMTTLGELREGAKVNVETDVLARTVVWWMEHFRGRE